MQKLISELKRLYFYKGQIHHDQDKTGESYFLAGNLTPAILEEHLAGDKTIALNLVAEDGTCRAMVFDFDGVAHGKGKQHWERLADLANKMQTELGLPAPAVAVSGRKGWGLWLSLEQPVPAAQAQQFLHLVRKAYLADIPKDELDLRPDTDKATKAAQAVAKLPPCLHRASGLWAAFINPGMGASFIEEAGLPAAPPGRSKHERGRAVDIVFYPADFAPVAGEVWEALGGLWGGRFKAYDPVHFEDPYPL